MSNVVSTPRRILLPTADGVVFLAYLQGHQDHFRMVGGQESARSVAHLAEIFRLADRAGLLVEPERSAERMRRVLSLAGIG